VGLGRSRRGVAVDMRVLNSRYPFMLVLPQRETERILAETLKSHGVEPEWRRSLQASRNRRTVLWLPSNVRRWL
jgi:hypothetical protein